MTRRANSLAFDVHCRLRHIPAPVPEYRFAPPRRWRFDWAWPVEHVAVEIEGGVFLAGGSRHTRGAGFRSDLDKYNTAAVAGWIVLRVLPEDIASDVLFDRVRLALARRITLEGG